MTYNVLKSTCSFSFYPHCDTQHMLFPYRLANQAREIEALAPDVACLQEVDKYQEYLSYLSKTYSGVYKKREKGDGCALFYNRERYYVGEVCELDLGFDTVALLVPLMPLEEDDSPLLVATTHLSVWFDDAEIIRHKQTRELLSAVNAWKKAKEAELGQENVPIVLCGDFNSTPDSSIYALLTSPGQARPPAARPNGPRGNRGGAVKSPAAGRPAATSDQTQQTTPWRSAYALHQQTAADEVKEGATTATTTASGEPPYTTLLPHSAQVVDYILWPAASPMRVRALVPIPRLAEGSGLPSALYSSDHFSLMCELA
ncbi:endonuclease/exonuclease/phosphatase family protein [Acanthamoeba castellanii str. Neff]|uniref:Endonuclease/exonuclease/phosphatase family protein n=1 Tax=Acanthamoeba castellanii (strain ATCC 30010 / Neff) TaxID=1257118 RepID=L8GSN6_ACACF|nr:endonuclease/exonuclease/phosphatase family protein [Acanthamoeba castellanii str. Neff]ELR15967.1 endonuclease/exonuclease/phosphatase family protein [Acanthamoeba castellanii str. Neff]